MMQGADVAASPDALVGLRDAIAVLRAGQARLAAVESREIPRVNGLLRDAGLAPIAPGSSPPTARP
ncbi:MAG: hypothetical protein ACM3O7_10700 [Acidobacteriota bacterium]